MTQSARVFSSTLRASPTSFLTASQVKWLNRMIEGTNHTCDNSMLESAINAPINQQFYANEHDIARLAAVLGCRIIKNHSFSNGNKRTALLAANLFLLQNGKVRLPDVLCVESNDMLKQAHDEVAIGKLEEDEFAEILRKAWRMATDASYTQPAGLYEE
ncbi:hypothetical protein ACLMJK_002859 [Lecanora helva]